MIRGRDIVKRFGHTTAVDGVTFDVMKGETYGLLGPNGAGKTTLMRLLSALSPLSSGELVVAGLDVTRQGRAVRERLGVVTQQDGLDTDLTVRSRIWKRTGTSRACHAASRAGGLPRCWRSSA